MDLRRGQPQLIHSVVKFYLPEEPHRFTGEQEFTLFNNLKRFRMFHLDRSKQPRTNLFPSILKEYRFFDNRQDLIWKLGTFDCNPCLLFKSYLYISGHMLGDWHAHQSLLALVCQSPQLNNFHHFLLVHKPSKRICPALTNCLKVLDLLLINVKNL